MLAEQCPCCHGAAAGTQQRPLRPPGLSSGPDPSQGTWCVLHHPTVQSAENMIYRSSQADMGTDVKAGNMPKLTACIASGNSSNCCRSGTKFGQHFENGLNGLNSTLAESPDSLRRLLFWLNWPNAKVTPAQGMGGGGWGEGGGEGAPDIPTRVITL